MNKIIQITFVLAGFLLIMACEKFNFDPPTIDPEVEISFQNDIQPIFTAKCIACHGSGKEKPLLVAGSSYSSLTTGTVKYISDDPVNSPETSKLYEQITTDSRHTSILNEIQELTILEWIRQGAENN